MYRMRVMKRKYFVIGVSFIAVFLTVNIFRYNNLNKTINTFQGDNVNYLSAFSAITGKKFAGNVVRKFPSSEYINLGHVKNEEYILGNKSIMCKKWAVYTTIFLPSEAIRRQARLSGWCLVIVADLKTPLQYNTGWFEGQGNIHVIQLSVKEQKEDLNDNFISGIPWNNFGRKNIGFLYAIQHGAEVVWDFDDDNMLKFWIEDAAPPGAPSIEAEARKGLMGEEDVAVRLPRDHAFPTYNPYPVLGAPSSPSWPRGLPLKDIKNPRSYNASLQDSTLKGSSIGVLQSLADLQPDVDAIYRLTNTIPFSFNRLKETKPLIVPHGTLTPFNAQATLHFKRAFWGMFLPVSVNARVSDIWRSYIVGRLFWDCGLFLGFSARPLVVQNRNEHDDLRDLAAEGDLYQKSEQLVAFLGEWKSSAQTFEERIQELWIALYERQYIEKEDVDLVQGWLSNLIKSGYKFPEVSKTTISVQKYPKIMKNIHSSDRTCSPPKPLRFWTADLHDGSRMTVPTILATQNHEVYLAGSKVSVPHKNVLSDSNNKISIFKSISDVVKKQYLTHTTRLTEDMIKRNFEFHKSQKEISNTDAFFCMFPPSMCEMWMPFNKSIIFLPAHRYNLGRCTTSEWERLDEHLQMLASSPHHIIGAESMYDQEYLTHYTGLEVVPLHSYAGYYTKHVKYNPIREEIILVEHGVPLHTNKFKLVGMKSLYKHYELADLGQHRAIVYVAYSVMSFKLTEFYSMAIPLFMPSLKYYRTVHHFGPDRSSLSSFYCKNETLDKVMRAHPNSIHMYSPNSQSDIEAEMYWLQLSDFYFWPHITYFDNETDLEHKLEHADFESIHQKMVIEVEKMEKVAFKSWCEVTKRIDPGRTVPQNYDEAIHKLYGVSRLQVF